MAVTDEWTWKQACQKQGRGMMNDKEENSRGRHLNTSLLGKGVWTKSPRTASGMDSRTSLGMCQKGTQ